MTEPWIIATGFLGDSGHVRIDRFDLHPMALDVIQSFPHRIEVWTTDDDGNLDQRLSGGAIDKDGNYFALEHDDVRAGAVGSLCGVSVIVDILGVGVDH